jgi:hypothetical protein
MTRISQVRVPQIHSVSYQAKIAVSFLALDWKNATV